MASKNYPQGSENKEEPENSRILIQFSNHCKNIICNLTYLDSQLLKLRNSTYNLIIFPTFEQLLDAPSILHWAQKSKPMPGWPLTLEQFRGQQLKLNEAFSKLQDQIIADKSITTKLWMKFDILLSIEYLKTFEFFRFLKFHDKTLLAKHVTIIIQSMMIAFTSFQNKSDCFKSPDGYYVDSKNTCKIFNSKTNKNIEKNEPFLKKLINSSQNIMGFLVQQKITDIEYSLLKAIAICDPIFDLSEEARNIIWENRQNFSKILLNYCSIEYGKRDGPSRFVKLISYINLVISHQKSLRKFIMLIKIYSIYTVPEAINSLEDTVFDISI